jgi:hypothetical protein
MPESILITCPAHPPLHRYLLERAEIMNTSVYVMPPISPLLSTPNLELQTAILSIAIDQINSSHRNLSRCRLHYPPFNRIGSGDEWQGKLKNLIHNLRISFIWEFRIMLISGKPPPACYRLPSSSTSPYHTSRQHVYHVKPLFFKISLASHVCASHWPTFCPVVNMIN